MNSYNFPDKSRCLAIRLKSLAGDHQHRSRNFPCKQSPSHFSMCYQLHSARSLARHDRELPLPYASYPYSNPPVESVWGCICHRRTWFITPLYQQRSILFTRVMIIYDQRAEVNIRPLTLFIDIQIDYGALFLV